MNDFQEQKKCVLNYFQSLESSGTEGITTALNNHFSADHLCYAVYPFNEVKTPENIASKIWQPLLRAMRSMERRQDVFMAGKNHYNDEVWVMSMGHFMGLFDAPWLGIAPTGKLAMLRYAEFCCVEQGKITKSALFFDIIGFMQFAGLQPLPVSTGQHFVYPGPKHHDGILLGNYPANETEQTMQLLNQMIDDLVELNETENNRCPPEFLARSWDNNMAWYGPAGIGASYTIERYQQHHQYPFRENLGNKKFNGHLCRIAENNFASFFGWPNLSNTATGGFLGLPASGIQADMRVVDVYCRRNNKLTENWVIIDLPYWLKQQGLDIIERTTRYSAAAYPSAQQA